MVLNLKCLPFFMTFFINVRFQDAGVLREPFDFYMKVNNIKYFPNKKLQQYDFYDGEAANFTCYTPSIGHVVLQYSSANDRKITLERHPATSVYIYKKLKSDDLFSCTHGSNSTSNHSISVMTAVRKKSGTLTFKVNNLVLSPYYEEGGAYYYRYKYYSGELLKIDVLKDDEFKYMSWNLGGDVNVPSTLIRYLRNHTALADLGPFTLKKIDIGTSFYSNFLRRTDRKKYNIVLTFLLQTQYYDPYIYHLSLSNVFLQYTPVTGANIIEYEIGNGTANLRCSRTSNSYWKYSRDEVNRTYNNVTSSYQLFNLQPYCNSAEVTCRDKNTEKTTHLTFFRGNHLSKKCIKKPSTKTPKELTTRAVVATTTVISENMTKMSENVNKTTNCNWFLIYSQKHLECDEAMKIRVNTKTPQIIIKEKHERTTTDVTTQPLSANTLKTKNINKKTHRTIVKIDETTEKKLPIVPNITEIVSVTDKSFKMWNLPQVISKERGFGSTKDNITTKLVFVTDTTTTLESFSSSEILAQVDSKDSANSTWVVVAVVVATLLPLSFVIIGTLFTVRYCRQRNKIRCDSSLKAGDGGDDPGAYDLGLMDTDHVYETIQDPIYDEPYACPIHAESNEPVRDMSKRPPPSVPGEEMQDLQDDDKKYIHYDTPYDFRIFRFGDLTSRYPNLFRTQRSRLRPN